MADPVSIQGVACDLLTALVDSWANHRKPDPPEGATPWVTRPDLSALSGLLGT